MNDALLRWSWTVFTGLGVLFALWNLREVLIDNWAVSQVRPKGMDVYRMQVRGEVWNHALIFVVLASDFLAGVSSLMTWATGALLFLLLSAGAAVALSLTQTRRRRRIFDALRLGRVSMGGK